MSKLYLNGLVRSKICGLGSGFCPAVAPSSVFTERLMAECGKNAPGVLKGYVVLKRSTIRMVGWYGRWKLQIKSGKVG